MLFTKEDLPTWPMTVRKDGSTSVIQERQIKATVRYTQLAKVKMADDPRRRTRRNWNSHALVVETIGTISLENYLVYVIQPHNFWKYTPRKSHSNIICSSQSLGTI